MSLAEQKCESMIITQTRTQRHEHHRKRAPRAIQQLYKILGSSHGQQMEIHLPRYDSCDQGRKLKRLARIMPNISSTRQTKRKLLSNVAHSVMLYGAPVWSDKMSATDWTELLKVQRRICSRVASAYCTTSGEAVLVITGIPLLNLLAKERKQLHDRKTNREQGQQEENILDTWQAEWDNCGNGRWTHALIPQIGPRINRRHGETNFSQKPKRSRMLRCRPEEIRQARYFRMLVLR